MIESTKAVAKARPRDVSEVRRKVRVPGLRNRAEIGTVEKALTGIDGVVSATADPAKSSVLVDYLVTKTDFHSIEHALQAAGYPSATGWWARFKSGWYQNLDLTGRENAAVPPAACCSKPPRRVS